MVRTLQICNRNVGFMGHLSSWRAPYHLRSAWCTAVVLRYNGLGKWTGVWLWLLEAGSGYLSCFSNKPSSFLGCLGNSILHSGCAPFSFAIRTKHYICVGVYHRKSCVKKYCMAGIVGNRKT